MKLLFFIFVVSILISVLKMTLWLLTSLICYATNGKFFGRLIHKTLKRHDPGNNPITCYHNSIMSNCKYCGKRIIKVGKDWFVLEQQNKGGK